MRITKTITTGETKISYEIDDPSVSVWAGEGSARLLAALEQLCAADGPADQDAQPTLGGAN